MEIAPGFTAEDYEDDHPTEVWPENWGAFRLFASLGTQWQVRATGGVIGLRYEAVYPLIDRACAGDSQAWDDLFSDIRVMEVEAMRVINEKAQ